MIQVADALFVKSATAPDHYPPPELPEVAFVGRSNVGKSSMINSLSGRKKLVRVSNTPGRTRLLNFFDLELIDGELRRRLTLADLPGYGFAKVSKTERHSWTEMISTYMKKRKSLKLVVSIIDAEVGPTSDDFHTLDYLAENAPRILVVATKIDRIPKAKRIPRMKDLEQQLEFPKGTVIPYSATEKWGVEPLWDNILSSLF